VGSVLKQGAEGHMFKTEGAGSWIMVNFICTIQQQCDLSKDDEVDRTCITHMMMRNAGGGEF
jgi:hypothetical protein